MKYCSNCDDSKPDNLKFCTKCGTRLKTLVEAGEGETKKVVQEKTVKSQKTSSSGGEKSKIAAGILGILVGGLGVHKFYLGKTGTGILYLCFCWTYVPTIIGLIEGIYYLCMSDEKFHEKYG